MRTVLIVEDEKLIRQGIRTMIQRSNVPVELILECNNGEKALEIIQTQEVDVLFTDIRMPKMDGIELVHQVQKCSHIPIIVAISGFDDFSYAVEMLRNGVREYLLKPVEREKITKIMQTFQQELEMKQQNQKTNQMISIRQIRYLMETDGVPEEELNLFEKHQQNPVTSKEYQIVVCTEKQVESDYTHLICIEGMELGTTYIGSEGDIEVLQEAFRNDKNIGISDKHIGLLELRKAYLEAVDARKRAYIHEMPVVHFKDQRVRVAEALRQQAIRFLDETAEIKRVQLIGTERIEELEKQWNTIFQETEKGRILPCELEQILEVFLTETMKIYANSLSDESREYLNICRKLYEFETLHDYRQEFLKCIRTIYQDVHLQADNNHTKQKIQHAITYIHENYAKDLNLAVVSNEISMNYSLFSYSFKQFTGSNFVNYLKDIRIQEAKKLLAQTDMKIIEISQAVGYENEKNFMKIFKNACGVSATEYRKNMKGSI